MQNMQKSVRIVPNSYEYVFVIKTGTLHANVCWNSKICDICVNSDVSNSSRAWNFDASAKRVSRLHYSKLNRFIRAEVYSAESANRNERFLFGQIFCITESRLSKSLQVQIFSTYKQISSTSWGSTTNAG